MITRPRITLAYVRELRSGRLYRRVSILDRLVDEPALRTELVDAALRADRGRRYTVFTWQGHRCRLGYSTFRALVWIKFRGRWCPAVCREL
jgi:hypothetical protein